MRKICFITGTRADYGIMSRLMQQVNQSDNLVLQVIATNTHLSPKHGMTYREIEADGLTIDRKVEMLPADDSAVGTLKGMGMALTGLADALQELQPDLCVILGDRYEALAAAQAALIHKIPVAHLYGGEITMGAYDDAIRHAITKLSHLHFTSTEEYRQRIIQMGEQPDRVFWVGALGIDNMLHESVMTKQALEESLNFSLTDKYMLVTFHPVTMEDHTAEEQCRALLQALEEHADDYRLLFTLPGADVGSNGIISLITSYAASHADRCIAVPSLGKQRYYAALKHASAVVGNSSSGLVEASAFHVPTLNIGDRQKGRARGESVADCEATLPAIRQGLAKVLSPVFRETAEQAINPYQKADTLKSIYQVIATYPLEALLVKTFYDIR